MLVKLRTGIWVTLLFGATWGCQAEVTTSGRGDGAAGGDTAGQQVDSSGRGKVGDPCLGGSCEADLLCMAGSCHRTCSTDCGQAAPECQANEGCHLETSFDAICIAGTAKEGEPCGGETFCLPGLACVKLQRLGTTKCYALCNNGACAGQATCSATDRGCKFCAPN